MRSIRLMRLVLAAALFALAPAPSRALAQDTAPAATSTETATTAPAATDAAAPVTPSQSSGLPVQSGPPRTLRAYWHVFAAFTITWLLVFGYVISLGRRFGKLEREMDARTAS
ncbi:MAG TPA: CcmD family protein [Longimicrobium sp.]|nr:CcmD family protein [Longimicrobium sp.]